MRARHGWAHRWLAIASVLASSGVTGTAAQAQTPAPRTSPRLASTQVPSLQPVQSVPSRQPAPAFRYSRAIPRLPRPPGFPDPALRVHYASGASALPLQVRFAGSVNGSEPIYRRLSDGSYVPITAPGFQRVNSSCPSQAMARGNPHARMIDLAAAEWAWFGLPVLDLSAGPSTAVPRETRAPDAFEIIDPSRNFSVGTRVLRRAARLGLMEDDAEVRATIAGYWAATGDDDALRVQRIVNFGDHGAGWATPWSAAFVSWLACEAGLSPAAFRRSGSHIDYVRAAVRARDGDDATHAFVAYDLAETVPQAGDLLCTARAGAAFTSLADVRSGTGDSSAMHCDLVVKTDPSRRRIYAIGGNIAQAVTLSIIASDAGGRPLVERDVAGASRWFAVLKPRQLGAMSHTLDRTPTVLGLFQGWRGYSAGSGSPPPAPLKAGP